MLPSLAEAMDHRATDPALAPYTNDAELASLQARLAAWDRRMSRASAEAVVYEAFQHFYARQVLADDLDVMFDAILSREPVYIMKLLAMVVSGRAPMATRYVQQGRDVLALRALAQTRAWLIARFGGVEASRYTWGAFHTTRPVPLFAMEGPFAVAPEAADGSIGTVNVSQAQFFDSTATRMTMESHAAPAYRMVMSFGEDGTLAATLNFPRGNSGDPTAPDWSNAQADWSSGTYQPLAFERAAVDAAMRLRSTLAP